MTSHGRPSSPIGRRLVNAGSTSTATFAVPQNYHDHTALTRTPRDYVSSSRASADRSDAPRVVTLRQRSPTRKSREDGHDVRPRVRTHSLDPGDASSRRPLSLIAPKPSSRNTRPIITKELERPKSPVPKSGGAQLEASYIVPASSSSGRHHQRHSSLNTGDRLAVRDRDRDHLYPDERSSRRDEHDYSHDYNNPREQVLRDLAHPPQRPSRRESYNGPRPTSMVDLDRYDKVYPRIERDAPPPATTRGFDTTNRHGSLKQSFRPVADDIARKDSITQSYPREGRDGGRYHDLNKPYSSSRDDYVPYPEDNPRHQRPRRPTLESENPPLRHRDRPADDDDRNRDRHRNHHHYHEDFENRRDANEKDHKHHRRDAEEIDGRERRKDYDDRYEREHRKSYDDRHDRERRKQYDERGEKERRKEFEERDHRIRPEPHYNDDDPSQKSLLTAGGTAAAAALSSEPVRRQKHRDEEETGAPRESHSQHLEREARL